MIKDQNKKLSGKGCGNIWDFIICCIKTFQWQCLFNKKLQSIKAFQQGKDIWRPNINIYYSKKQILDEIEKDLETVDTMPDDDMPMPDNISDIHKHKENHRNNNKGFADDQFPR